MINRYKNWLNRLKIFLRLVKFKKNEEVRIPSGTLFGARIDIINDVIIEKGEIVYILNNYTETFKESELKKVRRKK